MNALRVIIFTAISVVLPASVSLAAEQSDTTEDLKRELYMKLRGADPNSKDKYHIDLYFSPLHAMRVYTELLRWSEQRDIPPSQAKELQAIVSMGLLAVYRDSGAGVPMGEAGPISIVFDYSLPRYARPLTDKAPGAKQWKDLNMKRQTGAAGIGQSLAAKSLWLRRIGGEGTDVILRSLLGEIEIITAPPFLNDGGTGPVPEVVAWEEGEWRVKDPVSRLRSQASLIIGLSETRKFLDDPGDLKPKIEGIERLRLTVDNALAGLFRSMLDNHRDPETGALIGLFDPASGKGDRILIEDLGIAAEALGALSRSNMGKIAEQARRALREQADFVQRAIPEGELAPRGWFVPALTPWRGAITTLSEQVGALMVLIEASNTVDKQTGYVAAANRLHTQMEEPFWVESVGLYRSATGFKMSSYDGYLFGTLLGLLRQAEETGIFAEIDKANYLQTVLISAGLLQAEGPETGERDSPEALIDREINRLFSELAEMKKEEERKDHIRAFIAKVIDQDGDTIPGIRFGGDVYGGAPVLVNQTGVRTPYQLKKTTSEEGDEL